jgi:hypothetical protein
MKRLSPQHFHRSVRWAVVAAWAVTLVWAFAPPAQKANAQTTLTPWQHLTLSQLTAVWWQWVLSIPEPTSPLVDETGANAYSGQPYADLLFLCGTFTIQELQNGDLLGEVTRSISVKQGTALFFPLLNTQGDNVCYAPHLGGNCFTLDPFPQVRNVPELQALAAEQMDPATGLHTMLTPTDGPPVTVSHARLQPSPFSYTLPATDNLYQASGINVSGRVAPAVADGYWSLALIGFQGRGLDDVVQPDSCPGRFLKALIFQWS